MGQERFPNKLYVEKYGGRQRPTKKASNMSTVSTTFGAPNPYADYGIELGSWITWAINEGKISIAGGDTHMLNTNLTSSSTRSHTVTGSAYFQIWEPTNEQGIRIQSGGDLVLGNVGDYYLGRITIPDTGGVLIQALDGDTVKIGDTDGDENSNFIEVDDVGEEIRIEASDLVNMTDGTGAWWYQNGRLRMFSTVGGYILPNMTGVQGVAIASPLDGEIIYVTSISGVFTSVGPWCYVNGTWTAMT